MKILADYRMIELETVMFRGIGQYVRQLLHALKPYHEITLLRLGEGIPDEEFDLYLVTHPMGIYAGIDSPYLLPIKAKEVASIFYDTIPITQYGELMSWPKMMQVAYQDRLINVARHKILAISDSAYTLDNADVVVIGAGINHAQLDVEVERDSKQAELIDHILTTDYILTVGGNDAHKGHHLVDAAFNTLRVRGFADLEWVHAGRLTKTNGHKYSCYLDYVRSDDLASLYKHAKAVCFPSLIEGFGLPAWEARQYNTNVITNKIPVFKAFPGWVTDPTREAWSRTLRRILSGYRCYDDTEIIYPTWEDVASKFNNIQWGV